MAPNSGDSPNDVSAECKPKPEQRDTLSETGSILVLLFLDKTGLSSTQSLRPPQNPSSRNRCLILRRLTDEVIEKYQTAFNGMYRRVDLERQGDSIKDTIKAVADKIVHDGSFNWGRLVTLIAFVLHGAESLAQKGLADSEEVVALARFFADYIDNELGARLKNLGGWESLEVLFPPKPDYEKRVWNGLVGTFVGLGFLSMAVPAVRYLIQ